MSNPVIHTQGLRKLYGKNTALDSIDLSLEPNKIYGLLGRNGAGKTTLLNLLTARIFPSGGTCRVLGGQAYENVSLLRQISYAEEKGFYDEAVRVRQVLGLASSLYPSWDQAYAERLVEMFELDPKKKYKQLSRGMESSLGLILGLASRAPLTIFDEPSLGLDAVLRERFYDAVIADFAEHPRTVVISTHLIDEVSRLFEEVVIIDKGRVLMHEDTQELKERAWYVSGRAADVASYEASGVVLGREELAGTVVLSIYADTPPAPGNGVEVQPMPLQKLFVQLIDPGNHDRLKKGGVIQ